MKAATLTILIGWTLWVGQLGGSWTKGETFSSWAECDQAGQQKRQVMGAAAVFVGGMVSRPAPYACSQSREPLELEGVRAVTG